MTTGSQTGIICMNKHATVNSVKLPQRIVLRNSTPGGFSKREYWLDLIGMMCPSSSRNHVSAF
jgi:hypothetical protein